MPNAHFDWVFSFWKPGKKDKCSQVVEFPEKSAQFEKRSQVRFPVKMLRSRDLKRKAEISSEAA